MKKYLILAMAALSALALGAQETLTFEQCKALALANNTAIKNAALQSEVAKATRQEAFTKYFPNVSATGFAFTTTNHVMKYHVNENVPLPPIPDILPEGALFPVDFELSLIKKGVMTGINLVQPVFVGGQIVNGNKLAEVGEAVAELQSHQSQEQVMTTVSQYFWQLASLKSKLTTVEQVIEMLDTLESQVAVAVSAGVALRNDMLEVQLRRNEMQTSRMELKNGIAIVSVMLAQYIGRGFEPIDIATDISTYSQVDAPASLFVMPNEALPQTADYGLLQQNVRASELQQKMALGKNLPTIAVGAGYFFQNIMEQGHSFGSIYATMAVPISDWWGGSRSMKQARLKTEMARNQMNDYSELLQVKMQNAWNDLTTAYDKIVVARLSVNQSQENLQLNENCYKAGTITISDLLKAQTLYCQSNDRFVDAYGDYQVKKTEYLIATGRF